MPRKISHQMKVRILAVLVMIFAALSLMFSDIFRDDVPVSPVPVKEEVYLNPVVMSQESTTEVDESLSVPTHPLGAEESIGVPVRIRIPSIALNAPVEKVALTKTGLMDVPKLQFDAGWYKLGPRPGEIGSAAIDGHVDWVNGSAAVFVNLHKLKAGDLVEVQDDKGAIITFVVRESRRYDPTANATDVFISKDGKAHLNIITCDGAWDKTANQYSKRLVVFTDRE